MNAESEKVLRLRRVAKAVEIYSSPEKFKVCDQCRSISVKSAGVCPVCHAYRWQEDPLDVKATALVTSQSAIPFTAAVAPRI